MKWDVSGIVYCSELAGLGEKPSLPLYLIDGFDLDAGLGIGIIHTAPKGFPV